MGVLQRIACLVFLFACLAVVGIELPKPIAEWALNEGAGCIAKDRSGNGNDGQIVDAKWIKDETLGSVLLFNGKSSCVIVKDVGALSRAFEQLTIEATIKPMNGKKKGYVIARPNAFALDYNGKKARLIDTTVWQSVDNIDVDIESGSVYHILGVWDTNTSSWKVYVDGKATTPINRAQHSEKVNCSKSPVYIGTWRWNDGASYRDSSINFEGIIANVKLYDTAFSYEQAMAAYEKRKAIIAKTPYLSFSSPLFSSKAGIPSPEIILERNTAEGRIDSNFSGDILLSSSSPTGTFSEHSDIWRPISGITMKEGRATFYYKDIASGDVTISASAQNSISSTRKNVVVSALAGINRFVKGDKLDLFCITSEMGKDFYLNFKIIDKEGTEKLCGRLSKDMDGIDIASLPVGIYTIDMEIVKGKEVFEKRSFMISKFPPAECQQKHMTIKDGMCLYDGKPYLPIVLTMMTAWDFPETVTPEDFKNIADNGFNIIDVGWTFLKHELEYKDASWFKIRPEKSKILTESKIDMETLLTLCQNNNLGVMFRIYFPFQSRTLSESQLIAGSSIVRKYEVHPSILGWRSEDETDNLIKKNQELYNFFKSTDDLERPVYLNLVNSSAFKDNLSAADIISCDPYPIRGQADDLSSIPRSLDEAMRTINGNPQKVVWHTVQFFGSPGEGYQRCPTPAELKCMSFLALNHGARGLVFFNYYPKGRRRIYSGRGINEELWRYTKVLNMQIKEMAPVYLAGQRIDGIASSNSGIDVSGWNYSGKTYIVATNIKNLTIKASINSPYLVGGRYDVKDEKRYLSTDAGGISDIFSPYEVHIYERIDSPHK